MPAGKQSASSSANGTKGKTKGGPAPPGVTGKGDGKGKRPAYRERVDLNKSLAASSSIPFKSDTSKTRTMDSVPADDAVRTDYPPANLSASSLSCGSTIRCTWDSFGGPNATYILLQSKSGEDDSFEPICFGGGHFGEAKYSNKFDVMFLTPNTQYYFQICAIEEGTTKPGPCQPTPPLVRKTSARAAGAATEDGQTTRGSALAILFNEYNFSEEHRHVFHRMKRLRNMPSFFANLADEEIIWAIAVVSLDFSGSLSENDIQRFEVKVEERLRRLEMAESRFGWFSLRWTKPIMRRLLFQWFCGMLVIDPDLRTREGSPIQFVHEYYGDDSHYPGPEDQTEEWKKEGVDLYVLMARSICQAYPMATKGIVSFSDMQGFDWNKYDMGSKERNSDICSLIPNKLVRMITFNPDEKMAICFSDMSVSARNQWGFQQYDDFKAAVVGESDFLPHMLPTFVGGTYMVDILKCLRFLFRREPEALALLLETHSEMEKSGELPRPKHMQ
eukprot:TRINITY_DN108249_c0_g1_i1.p1 TRINITY_DN108249_c0_g1~~TRINITY_DN108249_c0_g1_i1.p1  ORF type:complete len:502 (-),score=78.91 TRINITY_DN108249_c0_g1_i1:423-1928(-)